MGAIPPASTRFWIRSILRRVHSAKIFPAAGEPAQAVLMWPSEPQCAACSNCKDPGLDLVQISHSTGHGTNSSWALCSIDVLNTCKSAREGRIEMGRLNPASGLPRR